MRRTESRRILAVLAASQAAAQSGGPLVVLVGGLVGSEMAPGPSLATLPVAALIVGLAAGTLPATSAARRLGRRRGLALGSAVAATGSVLAALAVHSDRFALLCSGILLIGVNLAFVQQYRFVAAEAAPPGREARAVSVVLAAGVTAGVLGPALASGARDWTGAPWAGAFVALGAIYLAVAVLLIAGLQGAGTAGGPTPASRTGVANLLGRPRFRVALAAGVSSWATMILLMTATPLAMQAEGGHGVAATARVIQAHSVAMYAPSLVTGILVSRLGPRRVMLAGLALLAACVAVALGGRSSLEYGTALVLLGVGWNLLFVAGTVELGRSCAPGETLSAQGLNDFLVFGGEAVTALGAGALLHRTGWAGVNLVAVILLASMLTVLATHGSRAAGRWG